MIIRLIPKTIQLAGVEGGAEGQLEKETEASRGPKRNKPGEVRRDAGTDERKHRGFVSEVEIRQTSSSDSLPPSLRHNTLQTAEEEDEEEEGRSLSRSLSLSRPT